MPAGKEEMFQGTVPGLQESEITEACKVIIETLFNSFNIDKIIADTLEDNLSSRKVLEKLNFTISHTETKNNIKFIVYTKEKRC